MKRWRTSSAGWRTYNAETGRAIGFYGLGVYALWESLYAVFDYLEEHHPDALEIARKAVHCFEPYGEDPQEPGTSRPTLTRFLSRNLYSSAVMASVALPPNYRPDGNLDPAVVTSQPVNLANHGSLSHRHSEYVSGRGRRNGTQRRQEHWFRSGQVFSANWLR